MTDQEAHEGSGAPIPARSIHPALTWITRCSPLVWLVLLIALTVVLGRVHASSSALAELLQLSLVAGGLALVAHGWSVRQANPLPTRPEAPEPQKAATPDVGPEPDLRLSVLADNCTICGRALLSLDSRLARVGTECIKTHGPRHMTRRNPAHGEWVVAGRVARAEMEGRQRVLDAEYTQQRHTHEQAVTRWEATLQKPQMLRAQEARIRGQRLVGAGISLVGALTVVFVVGSLAL